MIFGYIAMLLNKLNVYLGLTCCYCGGKVWDWDMNRSFCLDCGEEQR